MNWFSSLGASTQHMVRVEAPTDVAEARRQALDVAARVGLCDPQSGQLAIAVTEAGTNIVKHAREGTVLVRALAGHHGPRVEVIALDKGPGMANVAVSMRDGHSTAGTPGNGLGALSRLTQELEIYTRAGQGTALRFEVRSRHAKFGADPAVDIGAVCIPKPGEIACGDAWAVAQTDRLVVVLVVDGLGHGPEAASASNTALDAMRRSLPATSAIEALRSIHRDLHGTRGAAGAVAVLDFAAGRGAYCGIGNISCATRSCAATRQLLSHNGILGHQTRTMQEVGFELPAECVVIAHSDGLNTHWRLEQYPGLERHHPALVAGVLYRDHCRGRDDATCLALRRARSARP